MNVLDSYSIRARLFPAILALTPAIVFVLIGASWTDPGLPEALTAVAIGVLFVGFADFARRLGKRAERQIFAATGGRPTNTTLRRTDGTLDARMKDRFRSFIAGQIEEVAPGEQTELESPGSVNDFYQRCNVWLRENTRDTEKYHVLFSENISYGFRRNLYGLRSAALTVNIATLAAAITIWAAKWEVLGVTDRQLSVVVVLAACHALFFLFFATRGSVMDASHTYGRQLTLSCEQLISSKK